MTMLAITKRMNPTTMAVFSWEEELATAAAALVTVLVWHVVHRALTNQMTMITQETGKTEATWAGRRACWGRHTGDVFEGGRLDDDKAKIKNRPKFRMAFCLIAGAAPGALVGGHGTP
jgi:hypothetical protein